jgi:hypothetical protein
VIYASATGASDVNNLAYATRLGLWGPETAFANRGLSSPHPRGRHRRDGTGRPRPEGTGLYTARALSFAGVEYDILEHALTPDQIATSTPMPMPGPSYAQLRIRSLIARKR